MSKVDDIYRGNKLAQVFGQVSTFSYAEPHLWNHLPNYVRTASTCLLEKV